MPKSFQECYEKIKLLGEGAFGAAFLVKPKGRREALQVAKEIRVSHLSAKQQEGALAESEVLRMLEHPNIIAYIDSFSEGSRMYIVMEYADGGDLAIKIKERKETSTVFEEREIMFIFVQLALALIYIHSRKVLHRDLKPLNIFLTKQGIVKLGDFGISRVLDSSTAGAQTTIGTPHYLSPEMVNNEAYGTRSDLWSLGVVTYELAALRVPFAGSSLPAVAMKIMGADPDPLPERYSQDLVWIVMGLLSKEPSQRPRLEAVQRMPYVQKYMQVLLSYSRQTGAGGCEAMTGIQKPSRSIPEPARAEPPPQRPEPAPQGGGGSPLSPSRQKAAQAEFIRTRQAAKEAKRRQEGEAAPKVGERRQRPRDHEEPGPPPLTGKEREAEVRRRAQAQRHELEAQRWSELNVAMREHQEERRRLALRLEGGTSEAPPPVETQTQPRGAAGGLAQRPEAEGGASPSGSRSSKEKRPDEALYLRQFEQAILEQAEERRRLAQKLAARRAEDRANYADAEVSAGSADEVDSDKENAVARIPLPRQAAAKVETTAAYQRGGEVPAPMVLEIPFTDKVKPKPKLSSDMRGGKRSATPDPLGEDVGRGRRPPPGPARPDPKEPSKGSQAAAIRSELGLAERQPPRVVAQRAAEMAAPQPGRASGSPAQWLRSASCDRPQPERNSAVLQKLPATRSRPSLDAYSSAKPAPAAPPTPQGEGDVSQLQDALAHALCNVEGVAEPAIHTIPEEIFSATVEAAEVPTMLLESNKVKQLLAGTSAESTSPSRRGDHEALEQDPLVVTVMTDWKDTYGSPTAEAG